MGLASALNATVGALRAQSNQISAVSENIANSSTTAYKIRTVNFQALVGDTGNGNSSGGGVISKTAQNIRQSGPISTTGISTNVAIKGDGFFVVSDNLNNKPAAYTYSRNGNFQTDAAGYLVNDEGYYLLGQVTDNLGVVTASNSTDLNSVGPVNVNAIQGAASPTTAVNEKLNLPADAPIGGAYTSSFEAFDSLGVSHTVTQTWTKTAANAWTLTLANPVLSSNLATTSGTISPTTINFTFNGNGSLLTPATSPTIAITGFSTGANNSSIAFGVGTAGLTDGITQFASNTATPGIEIASITGNGVRFGKLTSVEIADSGLVTAVFDNGLRQPVYQIPVATFPNPNGLTQVNGSVYDENQLAGVLNLQKPTVGNAGSLVSKALEGSNTDISEEFNKLIVAQQAYSAAAQIITTVRTLNDTLNQAIR
jgi:flagellar hook protein FlgE